MLNKTLDDNDYGKRDKKGYWLPFEKFSAKPKYLVPFKPLKFIFNLIREKFALFLIIWFGITLFSWFFLTPSFETMKSFEISWIAFIFFRNLTITFLSYGFFHLRFYTFNAQGNSFKYSTKNLEKNNSKFFLNNQLLDNMFYTLCSGVTIWTTYEVLTLWAFANDIISYISWELSPLYFCLIFFFVLHIQDIHFYFVHRLLHWKPLYKIAHNVHHRNVNTGPWSGLSMHPLEHMLYFSGVLIFWIVPSHPLIAMWYLFFTALAPVVGHSGYEKMIFKNGKSIHVDNYFHYLHHRYFNCNYSSSGASILDKMFGTFHDGSDDK